VRRPTRFAKDTTFLDQLATWFKKNKGDAKIVANAKQLSEMHDEIFNKLTCSHPGFAVALPPKLD